MPWLSSQRPAEFLQPLPAPPRPSAPFNRGAAGMQGKAGVYLKLKAAASSAAFAERIIHHMG
jgi:hypothetical protein